MRAQACEGLCATSHCRRTERWLKIHQKNHLLLLVRTHVASHVGEVVFHPRDGLHAGVCICLHIFRALCAAEGKDGGAALHAHYMSR